LISGLTTNAYYSVYAVSVDFNGQSLESDEAVFVVCLAPEHIDRPYYISATKTTISLGWTKPDYTGGCPILTYALLMKGPLDADFTEIDSAQITGRPYITEHTKQGLTSLGELYEFKISVTNEIGTVTSLEQQI
jgi:hypothetical protein